MHFVIVDVETTGGSPKSSKITEIAMFKYDGHQVIDRLESLVNPEQSIPEFIVRLTGITDQMVANAPKFFELAKKILEFCKDCVFVAHNVSFDYSMFRQEFKTLGYDFRFPHLCTVKAARQLIPGHDSYSLGKISKDLGIKLNGRHRASGDAEATVKLFEMMFNQNDQALKGFIQTEVNPKNIHPQLKIETVDELPLRTGIYKFYDEFNQLIYIGKSISIKKRVEQHLGHSTSAKGQSMRQEISRVEFEITGSALIAMLYESELIKQYKPKFNRQLRRSLFTYGLFDTLDESGYLALKIDLISKNKATPISYFTTRKEGQSFVRYKTEQYALCQKINGIYPSKDACFLHSLKQCHGACIGEEAALTYNSRVEQMIQDASYKSDSFFLVDKGRDRNERSLVWVDRGVYKGHGFAPFHFNNLNPEKWKQFIELKDENRDVKSILNLYLRKNKDHKLVSL